MSTEIALQSVYWQRMAKGIDDVKRRLERAAAALAQLGVDYAVVGGNAVAAWVSRVDESAVRNTRDVDILLRREDMALAILGHLVYSVPHRLIAHGHHHTGERERCMCPHWHQRCKTSNMLQYAVLPVIPRIIGVTASAFRGA